MYEGPGIAPQHTACSIQLPLTVQPLSVLLEYLRTTMGHNFLPALMVMGSCVMALHYNTILSKFLFCPVPLAFGEPGTGKTTALRCGLAITGAHPARFYSKATLEKYTQLCADSCLPLGIDDPKSKAAISDLTLALFNGAKGATIKRGEKAPSCMAVISDNFTTSEQTKYTSRCLLLEFMGPVLDIPMTQYAELPKLLEASSSAIGSMIGLGKKFVESGIRKMDDELLPELRNLIGENIIPRVLPSYSILLWFTMEIAKAAGMEYLCDDLLEHFCSKMCPSIVALQVDNQQTKAVASSMMQHPFTCKAPVVSLDEFGQELLDCCEGHHIYDIWSFLRTDVFSQKKQMLAIRPEAVPSLRPSTILYINQVAKNSDIGLKGRTEFIADRPGKDAVIRKVNRSTGKQVRCLLIYLAGFSEAVRSQLIQVTSPKAKPPPQDVDTTKDGQGEEYMLKDSPSQLQVTSAEAGELTTSMSDRQKFEKEEKEDSDMEQKQMEEELQWKMDEKQTCEMEKEIDSRKGKAEDKQMHESEEEEPSTSQRKRKKKQLPIPSSKRRTRQNTSLPSWSRDIDPNNPLPL